MHTLFVDGRGDLSFHKFNLILSRTPDNAFVKLGNYFVIYHYAKKEQFSRACFHRCLKTWYINLQCVSLFISEKEYLNLNLSRGGGGRTQSSILKLLVG